VNGKNAPTLNPAVFEVIGRENPQAVASLRDLGEGVRKFWGTYSIGLTIADYQTVKAMGGTPEESTQLRLAYIQVSLGRRLADLLTSVVTHINGVRLLDAALATRACIELAGALVYYEKRITSLFTAGISTQAQMDRFNDIIKKTTRGGRFDWVRWFLRGADLQALIAEYADEKATPTSPVQAKNVLDFIKALDESIAAEEPPPGLTRAVYALLCDMCHPAVGGYMLYIAVPQPPGHLQFDAHPNTKVASWFVGSIISPTTNPLMKHAAYSLQRMTHIAKTVKAIEA
jgi:hypothetical protein